MGVGELPDESGLADAGLAHERHNLTVTSTGPFQGVAELVELGCAPHEAREASAGCGFEAPPRRPGSREVENLNGLEATLSPARDPDA